METENRKPLVSICCETFNHAKYVRDALEGFLMQKTNFPIEILIHDDASTDGTADIIREYEAKYPDIIKPIYQTENQYSQGKSIWCEIQFPRAQGKYIALCEGDDFWTDPNKLQIQYDFMESHPDYSMCFHNADVIMETQKNNVIKTFANIDNRGYVADEIFDSWLIPTASTFFRAEFCKKIPLNKNFWCGDIINWLTMAKYGKIFGSKNIMSIYRQTAGGAMSSILKTTAVNRYNIFQRHLTEIENTFHDIISKKNIVKQKDLLNFTHFVTLQKISVWDSVHFFCKRSLREQIDISKRYCKLLWNILKKNNVIYTNK